MHACNRNRHVLEGIVCLGTVLHCKSEHLCHEGVLWPQGKRFVVVVYGILYSILHRACLLVRDHSKHADVRVCLYMDYLAKGHFLCTGPSHILG